MSKQSQAIIMFNQGTEDGQTRSQMIERMMSELPCSKAHASTLYFNAQKASDKAEMVIGDAPFVIFDKESTRYMPNRKPNGCYTERYQSIGAARSAMTRLLSKGKIESVEQFAIAGVVHFLTNIEKTHVVKSVMNGAEVTESVNTPFSCSVASEHYWQS